MFRSIKLGLVFSCSVPLLLGLLLFVGLAWRSDREQGQANRMRLALGYVERITERFNLANPINLTDSEKSEVNQYLDALVQNAVDFAYISILDSTGRILCFSKDLKGTRVLSLEDKQRVYSLRTPTYLPDLKEIFIPLLTSDGNPYGILRVGLDTAREAALYRQFLFRSILIGALSLLLAVPPTVFVARLFLGRCFAPLIQAVDRVAEGDFTRRVDTFTVREELLALTSSLNRLFETIESDKKQIHRLNSGLSEYEKLFSRTKAEGLEQLQVAERQAAECTERLDRVLQLSWEGILIIDHTGRVMVANPSARRMLRLEARARQLFVPDTLLRMINNLFEVSGTDKTEGNFELEDDVFQKTRRYRVRAQRLTVSGRQQVLAVLEDTSRYEQIEKEKNDLSDLLRQTILPTVSEIQENLQAVEAWQGSRLNDSLARAFKQIQSRSNYLGGIIEDWYFWDQKKRGEPSVQEQIQLLDVIRSLQVDQFQGFSEEIRYQLPDHAPQVNGNLEDFRRLLREVYVLLQLAVPGVQSTNLDALSKNDQFYVLYRKSIPDAVQWEAPVWLGSLTDERVEMEEDWLQLKLNIVRMLCSEYNIRISADVRQGQPTNGGRGVVISLAIPLRQLPKATAGSAEVDDLIKRFFIARV